MFDKTKDRIAQTVAEPAKTSRILSYVAIVISLIAIVAVIAIGRTQ